MTVGPWKPIRLETYATRIAELDVRTGVNEALDATIDVTMILTDNTSVMADVKILNPAGGLLIGNSKVPVQGRRHSGFGLSKGAYEPWWPIGYGKQPIYAAQVTIYDKVRRVGCCLRGRVVTPSLLLRCVGRKRARHEDAKIRYSPSEGRAGASDRPAGAHLPVRGERREDILWWSVLLPVHQSARCSCYTHGRPGSNWIPADSFLTT